MTTTTTVANQLLSGLQSLPEAVQNNLRALRKLDERTQELATAVDVASYDYLRLQKTLPPKTRAKTLHKIGLLFDQTKSCGEDKVQLAMQTYELIDRYIRQFDKSNIIIETKLHKFRSQPGRKGNSSRQKKSSRKRSAENVSNVDGSLGQLEGVQDMPVDPNEPTYCLCNQVAYGEMIACDNVECAIEWFHYPCVNLKKRPRGDWFCPQCAP